MINSSDLQGVYPWTASPLIVSAPMAQIAMPKLAVAVSKAGGLGFIAAGYHSDHLEDLLEEAKDQLFDDEETTQTERNPPQPVFLPVGVGFITWSASLVDALPAFQKYWPCAVWLFAPPHGFQDLVPWATQIRHITSHKTQIWVQVGTVADAIEVTRVVKPDVIVAQGSDAGGHSLARGASIVSLVPEICDRIHEIWTPTQGQISVMAAGGISDGRGVAAAINLGAQGCVMGTRFLASPESMIATGYQKEVLRAFDGGLSTIRTKIYDGVRDINGWPDRYDGRGVINQTYVDACDGLCDVKNRELYRESLNKGDDGYGPEGRLCTYAGTAVGLVKRVMSAGRIVTSTREEANRLLYRVRHATKL